MSNGQRNTTLKALVDESIVELMPKTTGEQVYLDAETKLSPKVAEMVSAINLRTKKTDHIADVETLNETIDTKVADAIHNSDTKNSELRTYVDENVAAINASMTSSHTAINDAIASANADIALRAKQADVDTALDLKANKTDVANDISALSTSVDTKLAEKANSDDMTAALDLKANKTDVDSTISNLSNSVDTKLAEKANTTDVDTKITNLKQEILGDLPVEAYDTFTELAAYVAEHKELSDSLTEAINTKANKTDVDAALDLKANKTDVANDISALSTSVDSKLVEKANKTDVNNALDLKANKTDVNSALDLKANKTDVESALSGKVNTSDLVDPGNATITLVQGGAIKGTFTVNQSNNVEINLDNNNPTYFPMVGASSTKAGAEGLVPAPAAGKQASFLRGDGTWATPTDTKYTLESFGVSATASEINQLGGVKSNVQVQLDSKADSEHTHDDRYYTETEIDSKLSNKGQLYVSETKPENLTTADMWFRVTGTIE